MIAVEVERLSQPPSGSLCVMLELREQMAWLFTQPQTLNPQTKQIHALNFIGTLVTESWSQKHRVGPCWLEPMLRTQAKKALMADSISCLSIESELLQTQLLQMASFFCQPIIRF